MAEPLAYFITFSCYGTWLHGDAHGSVDRAHNVYGDPLAPPDPDRQRDEHDRFRAPPYVLDEPRRRTVLDAVRDLSRRKGWKVWAVHVRSNHVHAVVTTSEMVERVMNDLKAAASRRLNKSYPFEDGRPRWTRHGSTRYLWTEEAVADKVAYVLEQQGEPMARFPEPLEP